MLFQSLLMGALASSALAAPSSIIPRATTWTLENFMRTCNDTSNECRYSYLIVENDSGFSQGCTYTITGTNDTSARKTDYSQVPCEETSRFSLNQGYDADADFITLVPTDKSLSPNLYAFFSYTSAQLEDLVVVQPNQNEPAVPVGTFSPKEKRQTPPGWTVQNVTRSCNVTCTYSLGINENSGAAATPCTVTTSTNSTGSFYALPCDATTPYQISWGYNLGADSAVMTVVNLDEDEDAFFGFDGVNSRNGAYGSVGPNPVYTVGSFK